MSDHHKSRIIIFFSLFLIVVTILGVGAVIWQTELAKARQLEAQAQISEAQPDIIVARSQANINNAAAITILKDNGLVIVAVIIIVKDLVGYARLSNNNTANHTPEG